MRKKRFFPQFYKLWHRLKEYTSVSFIYIYQQTGLNLGGVMQ